MCDLSPVTIYIIGRIYVSMVAILVPSIGVEISSVQYSCFYCRIEDTVLLNLTELKQVLVIGVITTT